MNELQQAEINQRILENLNTVVLMFDEDLHLRYMNPAAEMFFAVSAHHMVGQAADTLSQCPGKGMKSKLSRSLATGHPFTEREVVLDLPNHTRSTVDCTAIPVLERGSGSALLIEIQPLDRQLRISREELLLNQQKAARDMIRGLAHEIKNPLGGLRGAAQLLERELDDSTLTEYTQVIIDEADRLQSLVDQLLGPNKLPKPELVNIHMILERIRHLVLAEYGNRIRIKQDFDPSIPELYVDTDRIIQAVLNIVRNAAREAGAEDDGLITLRTRILRQFTIGNKRHRLLAQIDIEDNGPGIPEEIREKIFYPMVTASEEGMGLGLSIAQSLINQHDGLIECRSEPGKTVFSILLPLEQNRG
jgi:two-component system nitrogen regulation sensor histidine kinase GlnL